MSVCGHYFCMNIAVICGCALTCENASIKCERMWVCTVGVSWVLISCLYSASCNILVDKPHKVKLVYNYIISGIFLAATLGTWLIIGGVLGFKIEQNF